MAENVSGINLVKILFIKVFTSDFVAVIVNVLLPVVVSIICSQDLTIEGFWNTITILCIIIVVFNIVATIVKNTQKRNNKNLNIICRCYNDQSVINEKAAYNIYSFNETYKELLESNTSVNNKPISNIADFQTTSMTICDSIQNMLTNEYGAEIKCEVTLMKKTSKQIKMVAYSNNDGKRPSSYPKDFSIDDEDIHFVELFRNLNGKISCLPDKKSVNDKFKKLKGSEEREKEICQYIGIPIKTNRNEIELLLQIDVSQKNVFGRTEEEVYQFAKNILYPYAVLLHKAYERDLVFSRYKDSVIKSLKNSN